MSETLAEAAEASLQLPVTIGQVTQLRRPGAEVTLCSHLFDSGLRLYDTHVRATQELRVQPRCPHDRPFIGAQVSLRGAATLHLPDCASSTSSPARGSLFRTVGSHSFLAARPKGQQLRVIGVAADLDMVANWFGGHLPASLRPFVIGHSRPHHAATLPVQTAHAVAAALSDTHLLGPMRALRLEGAAMQLMSAFLHSLCRNEHSDASLTTRDHRAALDAHAMLREQPEIPFTAAALAAAVNLPAQRLQHAFRELFGARVFEVQRQLRLDHAMTLLRSTYLPIRMIAAQVGYANGESFRRAFRAHFGLNPASVRSR